MSIRIKDIASAVGVSPATVSLVLNDKRGVGDEMREKVLGVARELGYKGPRSESRSTTPAASICLLHIARHGHTVNRDHDVFIADYIEGLGHGSKQNDLSMEIATFRSVPIEEIIESARAQTAAGLIVLGTELSTADVEAFAQVRKPLVFLDTYHDFIQADFVDMNNADSVFTVVSHLHAMGHRRIGLVTGSIETRNLRLREEGFQASLARLGLLYDARFRFAVDQTFHGAFEGMQGLLQQGIELPTALFCANDVIACGCLRAFRQAGIRVPDDLSLVGFDDLPISSVADPPLTTIQVSKAHIGRMAVQLLTMRIRTNVALPPMKLLIGGKLIERQSVRLLPSAISGGGAP